MSLSATLDTARTSLATTSERSAVAARNVARAGDPGASRKIAQITTDPGGSARVGAVIRAGADDLAGAAGAATSDVARQKAIVDALERIDGALGGDGSPSAAIGRLRSALQTYAVHPADTGLARTALAAADAAARAIRRGSDEVAALRQSTDEEIGRAVDRMNGLLAAVERLNRRIVDGTRSGSDVTDELDARDEALKGLAAEVGITVIRRADNDVAVLTDSGLTLFDRTARAVTFRPAPLVPGEPGAAVVVDGFTATGETSVMPVRSGRVAGLVEARDGKAIAYQAQLDEIARNLITALAESDQSAPPSLPDAAGLFHDPANAALAVTWTPGLAGRIAVNPSVDPAAGGDIMRLRDGGIANGGDPAYHYNVSGASGYTGRIEALIDRLAAPLAVDPAAGLASSASVLDLAAQSVGWVGAERQAAGGDHDLAAAILERAEARLAKAIGISIDDEMTELIELERTYQASSRLIATVDSMFAALLSAIG
jgi:flagellar hook-associated protein 1 FlgK